MRPHVWAQPLAQLSRRLPPSAAWQGSLFGVARRQVCTFHTAQQFWSVWNGVPQPSELLENKRFFREQTNGPPLSIDALMIFREGIEPQWEDEANAKGAAFVVGSSLRSACKSVGIWERRGKNSKWWGCQSC